MGKPLIQYRPHFDPELAAAIVSELGHPAETPEAVADLVVATSKGCGPAPSAHDLTSYVANLRQKACEVIADMAAGFAAGGPAAWKPRPPGVWGSVKCWRKYLSKLLRAKQPGRNGRKVRYALSKFPYMTEQDIRDRLDKLWAIEPELPRARVERLTVNTFLLTQ